MKDIEYKEFEKRYNKFKKNNLPVSFWDEERQTLEYVYFDSKLDRINKFLKSDNDNFDRKLHVERNLTEALGGIASVGFYYPYTCKYFFMDRKEKNHKYLIELGHTHSHDFDSVVYSLYQFPESFKIEDDELEFYSKQELEYLRRVQKYLLFLGIKDLDTSKPKVSRYRNARQKKYGGAYIFSYSDKSLNDFISRKRNFTVRKWYDGFTNKKYNHDYYALLTDEEDNIKMYVEFTKRVEAIYEDIKHIYKDERFKDEDKVILSYFKIIEIF